MPVVKKLSDLFLLLSAGDIQMVFGENTLNYVMNILDGQIDYLPRLSDKLLMHIIHYLTLEDIARLGVVSKQFYEVCKGMMLIRCSVPTRDAVRYSKR